MDPRKTTRIVLGDGERSSSSSPRHPYLTIQEGPQIIGRDFLLEEGVAVIGRLEDLAITLPDTTVSGRHLEIHVDKSGACRFVDLGSTNGTFLNGNQAKEGELQDGDLLQVGATVLKFSYKSAHSNRFTRVLYEMATRDPLTGLLNKRSFQERLDQMLARSDRTGEPLGLLMIDIDHFKAVNDAFGHTPAGDDVLRRVAETLGREIRKQDAAARWGGEEFAVLLPGQDAGTAFQTAERLRQLIERLDVTDLGPPRVTVSIGAASSPPSPPGDPAALVEEADQALYQAKRSGRNRCCTHPDR